MVALKVLFQPGARRHAQVDTTPEPFDGHEFRPQITSVIVDFRGSEPVLLVGHGYWSVGLKAKHTLSPGRVWWSFECRCGREVRKLWCPIGDTRWWCRVCAGIEYPSKAAERVRWRLGYASQGRQERARLNPKSKHSRPGYVPGFGTGRPPGRPLGAKDKKPRKRPYSGV